MTTRVGHVPPGGDGAAFDAALDGLEAVLANGEPEAVRAWLGRLGKARPFHITAAQLGRMIGLCCRAIGAFEEARFAPDDERARAAGQVTWIAADLIEASIHDAGRDSRAFVERSVDHARVLHPSDVEERTQNYRPWPNVPLHRDVAADLIAPYLAWLERRGAHQPLAHLQTAWKAVTCPLPPFVGIVWDWLDRRGEGEDLRLALSLHDLRERAQ